MNKISILETSFINRNGNDMAGLMRELWQDVEIGIDGYPQLDYQESYLIAGSYEK